MKRREFLKTAVIGAGIVPFYIGKPLKNPTIGTITYSFREMPDQSLEAVLNYVLDSGVRAVELMGDPVERFCGAPFLNLDMRKYFGLRRRDDLSETEKKELAEMNAARDSFQKELAVWRGSVDMRNISKAGKLFKKAGVDIYAFKPSAFGMQNTDAEINYGMQAAKALGAKSVTLEHPSNDDHTLKLGKMAEQNGMKVGYHGHLQQHATFWDTALEQSSANTLNLDFGHYVAAGNPEPLSILKNKYARISSMHLKDRKTKENGAANLPWGEGNTPIKEALSTIRDMGSGFPVTIELEYQIPEGSNSVLEVKKCLEYCNTLLG